MVTAKGRPSGMATTIIVIEMIKNLTISLTTTITSISLQFGSLTFVESQGSLNTKSIKRSLPVSTRKVRPAA
jgi:hypothetical protein